MGKVLSSQPYISLQEELPVPALSVSHPAGHGCCRLSSPDPGPPPVLRGLGARTSRTDGPAQLVAGSLWPLAHLQSISDWGAQG